MSVVRPGLDMSVVRPGLDIDLGNIMPHPPLELVERHEHGGIEVWQLSAIMMFLFVFFFFVLKEAREFFLSKGFGSVPQVLVNGVQLNLEEEDLETAIVTQMQHQTYEIQQAIFTVRM